MIIENKSLPYLIIAFIETNYLKSYKYNIYIIVFN